MIKQIINRKREGTSDIFICLMIIVCLLMITLYSVQLRIAQNEKYETDAAVIMAAESTLLMDLYQMSSTGESVLDCTGNAYSAGAYENPAEATKQACKIAYERFQENLTLEEHTYITGIQLNEFTVYNVTEQAIYIGTYNGNSYKTETDTEFKTVKNVKGKQRKINQTSIFVDIRFTVVIFGRTYEIPITEYVYGKV